MLYTTVIDSQEHLIDCSILSEHVERQNYNYSDIFSKDIVKQSNIAKYYADLLEAREGILDKEERQSAQEAGPLH